MRNLGGVARDCERQKTGAKWPLHGTLTPPELPESNESTNKQPETLESVLREDISE